jgi:translation initiation factor 1
LPVEICVCKDLARTTQKIRVWKERRKWKKWYTLVSGFDKDYDVKALGKKMKKKLACGGTVKNGVIVLQGDHLERVKQILTEQEGFPPESVET